MSLPPDPVRWTSAPDDAPEGLRDALSAAGREGPSDLQMRTLALKLAALSAGTAAAASASAAKAAATTAGGATAKTAGTFTAAKVLASLALAGVGTAGVVAYRSRSEKTERAAQVQAVEAPQGPEVRDEPREAAPSVAAPAERHDAEAPAQLEIGLDEVEAAEARVDESPASTPAITREPGRTTKSAKREPRSAAKQKQKHTLAVEVSAPSSAVMAVPSEVELLRRARAALGSRPREAFALTEQHRQHYARGTFVQERDVLAIEALMRAGELEQARDLARAFIRSHPNSPHAHRFRETMGL